jgi:hypothetical protein
MITEKRPHLSSTMQTDINAELLIFSCKSKNSFIQPNFSDLFRSNLDSLDRPFGNSFINIVKKSNEIIIFSQRFCNFAAYSIEVIFYGK